MDRAEERDVALPQLEDGPGADGPGEHRVADQGPGLVPAQLAIILKTKTNQHLRFQTFHISEIQTVGGWYWYKYNFSIIKKVSNTN